MSIRMLSLMYVIELCLFLAACSTTSTYRDMMLPAEIQPGYMAPTILSKEQWNKDRSILLLNLKRGYSGRFGIKPILLKQLYKDINAIKAPITNKELCTKIGEAFLKVPDNHLRVSLQGEWCPKRQYKPAIIGENLATLRNKVWDVEMKKYKNKNILYISISHFPTHKSPIWRGFTEKIKLFIDNTDVAVIDLRGNGGGDDTTGYQLSALFHKTEDTFGFPSPYLKQITSQTPETIVLNMNSAEIGLRWNDEPRNYYKNWKSESEKQLKEVLGHERPEQMESIEDPISENWKFTGYKIPIYILMDNRCGSSCESTIDSFEYNPYVKKVGQHTSGTLHFGNVASLFLKNSKLYIQTPTHAQFYRDGRFLEKIGLKPDIEVPSGTDAFTYLKNTAL